MLAGREPLLKLRLTRLADGAVIGVSLAHVVADGTRFPDLAAHLAARYRQIARGEAPDPASLIEASDRGLMSLKGFVEQQRATGADGAVAADNQPTADMQATAAAVPPSSRVSLSSCCCWVARAVKQLVAPPRWEMLVLHVPRASAGALKKMASGGCLCACKALAFA